MTPRCFLLHSQLHMAWSLGLLIYSNAFHSIVYMYWISVYLLIYQTWHITYFSLPPTTISISKSALARIENQRFLDILFSTNVRVFPFRSGSDERHSCMTGINKTVAPSVSAGFFNGTAAADPVRQEHVAPSGLVCRSSTDAYEG